ncbi:hypothetical protein HZS_5855 [Henneguya salminicola]|nr:hypothetical protein HZS_5855 [Henneguya salminicola]
MLFDKNFAVCLDSCNYILNFFLSDEQLETYEFLPKTKLKENPLHIYIATPYIAPRSKYNISAVVRHLEGNEIIDIVFINPDKYSKAEATNRIKLKGIHHNVFLCHRYTSRFALKNAAPFLILKTVIIKREIVIVLMELTISIVKETKGKYCKNLFCRNDCNGNGHCVNQGACVCNSIYYGKLCDEYPCSENIVNPCKNSGLFFQTNNSIKYRCPVDTIKGKYSEILSSGKKYLKGKCICSKNNR